MDPPLGYGTSLTLPVVGLAEQLGTTRSEVDARAERAGRRLGARLDAEREPDRLPSVDGKHDRVIALGVEHEAVEVQGKRCGALAVGGDEAGFERGALAERP